MIDDKQMNINRKIRFMFIKNNEYVIEMYVFFCFNVKL